MQHCLAEVVLEPRAIQLMLPAGAPQRVHQVPKSSIAELNSTVNYCDYNCDQETCSPARPTYTPCFTQPASHTHDTLAPGLRVQVHSKKSLLGQVGPTGLSVNYE